MGDFKGYISRQYTAWCGVCGNWEQVDELKVAHAMKRFRKMGWSCTKENGWTCPKCVKGKKT
jgi:hypothetical protein